MEKIEDFRAGSLARIIKSQFHIVATFKQLHSNIFTTKNELEGFLCLVTGNFEFSKNWGQMIEVLVEGEIIFLRKENLQLICKE